MTYRTHALAAIASAAIPGLDPVNVQELTVRRHEWFRVALVGDTRGRQWVVRVPLAPAAGAELDQTQLLTTLLDRRLPYALPVPQGHVDLGEVGRASVSPFIPGHPLVLAGLPAAEGLTAQIGRAVAALHDLEPLLLDEVAAPSYDTETYRQRRVADLDRAARTGRVPTGLLTRWEHALDEQRLWEFETCPVHGSLMGRNLLARFSSEIAEDGLVSGITGWEAARVADPADDFAWFIGQCDPEAWAVLRSAYTASRTAAVDPYLDSRARLSAEMHLMTSLLAAHTAGDDELVDAFAEKLRYLDYDTADDAVPLVPPRGSAPHVAAPSAALAEDEVPSAAESATEDDAGQNDAGETSGSGQTSAEQAGAEQDGDDQTRAARTTGELSPERVTAEQADAEDAPGEHGSGNPAGAPSPTRGATRTEGTTEEVRPATRSHVTEPLATQPPAERVPGPAAEDGIVSGAMADQAGLAAPSPAETVAAPGSDEGISRGSGEDLPQLEAPCPVGPDAATVAGGATPAEDPASGAGLDQDVPDEEPAFEVSPAPSGAGFVPVSHDASSAQLYDIPVDEDEAEDTAKDERSRP